MSRRRIINALTIAMLLIPGVALAQSASDLAAQIATLMQQIQAVQSQMSTTQSNVPPASTQSTTSASPSSTSCPKFTRPLVRGIRGDDVLALQRYLGSEGLIASDAQTGYFGALTEGAVQKWQAKYAIVSSGSAATTGWGTVGPRTARMIDLNCSMRASTPSIPHTDPISSVPSCPLAPRPAVLCSGTWRAVSDTNGCTTSWQCAVPLGATSTPAAPTPTQVSCPVNPRPSTSCAGSWYAASDSNGCTASWQCI